MSHVLINQYRNELRDLQRVSGSKRESVVREAFKDLLKGWARSHDLIFVPEYEIASPAGDRRYVDGALLHTLRMPFGYWEAKDENDDLDEEIARKLRRGYPQDNIIFEDSTQAVLIQNKQEVMRCATDEDANLEKLLNLFFGYERSEIKEFRKAVEQFKTDLPEVLKALREMVERAYTKQAGFRTAAAAFLHHAREAINPNITETDVREMLIQHILTEEIFSKVFGEDDFHHENNIARALYKLEGSFFTGDLKKSTLRGLAPYYAAIRSAAARIVSHHEKQAFLKVIYENFYKIYNVKAADRLGVVYTPNEIVRFMVESADWLCEKHFGKNLIDRDVDILDPATGTGTFICELMEHFRGRPKKLEHKYREELHANEVAILPYYVANLNIEATYAAITGHYLEFPNLCFVDTLDNVAGLRKYAGHMDDMFGSVSEENVARIKRQNRRRISVIIGNPPYNANQLNENENNKNREYPAIDKRISDTYMALRDSHKSKTYDMYARFFRWASDRIADEGIVVFVSNRSFIDKRAFDGFRKSIAREFTHAYIVDLGGDVRDSDPSTKANVFGIRVGVAISFLIRTRAQGFTAKYLKADHGTIEDKLMFLSNTSIAQLSFDQLQPSANGDWTTIDRNEFGSFLPLALPKLSGKKTANDKQSIFEGLSFGTVSNRDDWVWDHNAESLERKINFYIGVYSKTVASLPTTLPKDWEKLLNYQIKWTQDLRRHAAQRVVLRFDSGCIVRTQYRPFVREFQYYNKDLNWSLYRMAFAYPSGEGGNNSIFFSDRGARSPFSVLGTDRSAELHLCASTDGFQSVSKFRYEKGTRVENITGWALKQFQDHYAVRPLSGASRHLLPKGEGKKERAIDKEAIFHYVYAVLHDPVYREKYALNLKREFPRIPFYADFWRWADWGKELMDLHIGYETVEPYPLQRKDLPMDGGVPVKKGRSKSLLAEAAGTTGNAKADAPKALLRADKEDGRIRLDTQTTLSGIPAEAWNYRLGNRSALEWILDQYKEKKPRDPTIREKFNTYRFADYKEEVIDLLRRVTTVSVRTVAIVNAMCQAKR